MDLMHMDEQNSFRNMVIATVCGYGTDEKKATLHVQLPYMKKGGGYTGGCGAAAAIWR